MPAWNEAHYERAREFLRLVADAIPPRRAGQPASEAAAEPPAALAPGSSAPAPAIAPVTPLPAAPAAAPTAGSVFKKIQWKK